jgi:hypothetical protein
MPESEETFARAFTSLYGITWTSAQAAVSVAIAYWLDEVVPALVPERYGTASSPMRAMAAPT